MHEIMSKDSLEYFPRSETGLKEFEHIGDCLAVLKYQLCIKVRPRKG